MIYRAVKKSDGRYYAQYRHCFFWWRDSCHQPSDVREDVIQFARGATDYKPRAPRLSIVERVWP